MRQSLSSWWQERSARERLLVSMAAAVAVALFAWLAVARPLAGAVEEARLRQERAAEMLGAARAAAAEAARPASARAAAAPPGPIDRWIAAAAAEAGFTDASVIGDAERVRVSIASARAQAFFDWVAILEERGARVTALRAVPNATGNSVAASVTFARGGA